MLKGLTLLLVMSVTILAGSAFAADPASPPTQAPPDTGWTFAAAPYLWMTGIHGSIGQFGLEPLDVDASFMEILENFDIGGMAVAEARNGPFGIAMDFQYVKISTDVATPLNIIADKVQLTSETLTALAALEYRVVETEASSIDVMVGGRLWSVDTDVDPQGGPGDSLLFSDSATWVDPIIGVRARADLSEHFYLTGWGMVGGFGLASDLTWDVMGAIGYELNDRVSFIGGYRALAVDYSDGAFLFDVVQRGPIIGGVFRF